MAPSTAMLMSTVPSRWIEMPQGRRRSPAAVLALVALGLVAVAAVLVRVHPVELKSRMGVSGGAEKAAASLFKNALKSQEDDRAKHKAAELKLKSVMEDSIAREDGLSHRAKPLTDAALFKMAYKSEQAELKKRDEQVAELKAKATQATRALPV